MKKQTTITMVKIIAFILAFVLIIYALSATVFSKVNASKFSTKYSETMSVFKEPDNTLQIIGIGNSDLYSGICPTYLWENFGYTSNVIGSPRQTIHESQVLLEQVFEHQNPKIVLIECDFLYDHNPGKKNVKNKGNILDVMFDYLKGDDFEEEIKFTFSLFTFHDRWKNKEVTGASTNSHGYKYSDTVVKCSLFEDYMQDTDECEEVISKNKNDVLSLVRLCKKNGAEPVLFILPSPSSWNSARHNGAVKFAKENGLEFYDMNYALIDGSINPNKDYRDPGNHLNYSGAKKATQLIGEYIEKNYDIEDLRGNEKYDFWSQTVIDFKNKNAIKD